MKKINVLFVCLGNICRSPMAEFILKDIVRKKHIENRFHILEPENKQENLIRPDLIDAIVVPLVAFDKRGNRMGMGGGFYDRMLKKVSAECLLIGVAYDFQLIENVPTESWDMPLDEVITPTTHFIFNKKWP